jgi:hypothetical protein
MNWHPIVRGLYSDMDIFRTSIYRGVANTPVRLRYQKGLWTLYVKGGVKARRKARRIVGVFA